jgi:DNA invertase Pin-like site-specific DNA recombinase
MRGVRGKARLVDCAAGEGSRLRRLRARTAAEGDPNRASPRNVRVVLVWRLDPWGRSLPDVVTAMEELNHLGGGFVSLTEGLDLATPMGRAWLVCSVS